MFLCNFCKVFPQFFKVLLGKIDIFVKFYQHFSITSKKCSKCFKIFFKISIKLPHNFSANYNRNFSEFFQNLFIVRIFSRHFLNIYLKLFQNFPIFFQIFFKICRYTVFSRFLKNYFKFITEFSRKFHKVSMKMFNTPKLCTMYFLKIFLRFLQSLPSISQMIFRLRILNYLRFTNYSSKISPKCFISHF